MYGPAHPTPYGPAHPTSYAPAHLTPHDPSRPVAYGPSRPTPHDPAQDAAYGLGRATPPRPAGGAEAAAACRGPPAPRQPPVSGCTLSLTLRCCGWGRALEETDRGFPISSAGSALRGACESGHKEKNPATGNTGDPVPV
ncbi:hypothetical protein GCM10011428_35150 [Streptomyces violaceus]